MHKDIFTYAINNLLKRLMRSSLTILSILIGIMAIFALVSFGQGISKYTEEIFEEMGTNKIMVQPRSFSFTGNEFGFTKDEIKFISKISGVDVATGLSIEITDLKLKDEKPISKFVMGLATEGKERDLVMSMLTVDLDKGRYLKSSDNNKVMLGYNYQFDNKVFEKGLSLGDTITIKGQDMKIIGFLDQIGNPDDDSNVYLAEDYFKNLFDVDTYTYVYLTAKDGANVGQVAENIEEKLRKRRGLDEGDEDFFVQTFEDIMKTSGNVITVMNTIVLLIALVSVFVAAINITNTMYTSVLERTQEIGIMKAIGAKNSDIMSIFLIESGLQGLMGGIIGIFLGFLIAQAGGALAAAGGYPVLKAYYPLWLIIGCLVFSTAIGSGAGLLPAIQASKLKPVDALRYE